MIVDLPRTTVSTVAKALLKVREEGGAVALGRVLTLIIATDGETPHEAAIEAANEASREHPMRLIVISSCPTRDGQPAETQLDAEIRVGGDAGASEVVVLRAWGDLAHTEESLVTGLLLPDAPVVVWWPGTAPVIPGESALGRIAQRRITDAAAQTDPQAALASIADRYRPGDTDFSWTRLTLWRAQLAAALDQPPYEPVERARVVGSPDSPSPALMAAWLHHTLNVPTELVWEDSPAGLGGLRSVQLVRSHGTLELRRDQEGVARLIQPGQPEHNIALSRRNIRDCLADELRRLGPDEMFGRVVRDPLAQSHHA